MSDSVGQYLNEIGLVPLLTAVVGWCPPYAIFGINTCKSSQA